MIKRNLAWLKEVTNGECSEQYLNHTFSGISIDSRAVTDGQLFIPFKGENTDGHAYVKGAIESGAGAALYEKDAGTPPEGPVIIVENTLTALHQIAKSFLNEVAPKVIAITGSNGKTTTKDMIEAVLSPDFKVKKTNGNYNNEIGMPLTICELDEDTEISILEMGMSGFHEIELLSNIAEPDVAAITNIGESHMQDLGSREGIARAKFEITSSLKGPLLFDGDEPLLSELAPNYSGEKVTIGFLDLNDMCIKNLETKDSWISFSLQGYRYTVPVVGAHNARNAAIAICIGKMFGLSEERINDNIAMLELTGMRMQQMHGMNGSMLINDAYNASPTSMKAAVDTLSTLPFKRKILVFSDCLELGPDSEAYHREVGKHIKGKSVDQLFTVGEDARYITEEAVRYTDARHFMDKEALTKYLIEILDNETVVLFKASRGMKLETIVDELK